MDIYGLKYFRELPEYSEKKSSWVIWSIANIGWMVSFSIRKMPTEATLFITYLGLSTPMAVFIVVRWREEGEK